MFRALRYSAQRDDLLGGEDLTDIVQELRHALSLMESALAVLDKPETAFDVSAHLDLAVERLKGFLADREHQQLGW